MTRRSLDPTSNKALRELARALESIVVSTRDLSFDELSRRCQAVETAFLPRFSKDAELSLEVRRRVAERTLYAALDKNVPAESRRAYLDALERLGYTDFQLQAQVYIIYARSCLRTGENAEGIRMLEGLRKGIEAELGQRKIAYWRRLLGTCDELLQQLRANLLEE